MKRAVVELLAVAGTLLGGLYALVRQAVALGRVLRTQEEHGERLETLETACLRADAHERSCQLMRSRWEEQLQAISSCVADLRAALREAERMRAEAREHDHARLQEIRDLVMGIQARMDEMRR